MRSITPRTTWPEKTSSDCYDWISPETVIRLALGAYYAVSRQPDALPDDPDQSNAEFNNGRLMFAERLAEDIEWRLDAHGEKVGAPGFAPWGSIYLTARHGPRSADMGLTSKACAASACPTLDSGPERDIHRALSIPRRLYPRRHPTTSLGDSTRA